MKPLAGNAAPTPLCCNCLNGCYRAEAVSSFTHASRSKLGNYDCEMICKMQKQYRYTSGLICNCVVVLCTLLAI